MRNQSSRSAETKLYRRGRRSEGVERKRGRDGGRNGGKETGEGESDDESVLNLCGQIIRRM